MLKNIVIDKVSEFFNSWQGEGPRMGQRATFLRFKYCNLNCPFCDTLHKFKNKKPIQVTCKELQHYLIDTNYLVITGGEPLIHLDELTSVFNCIKQYDYNTVIGIETNGYSKNIDKLYDIFTKIGTRQDRIEIYFSPKLFIDEYKDRGSTIENIKDSLIKLSFISELTPIPVDIYAKIVVSDIVKTQELIELTKHVLPTNNIYLMPEGKNKKELTKNYQNTTKLAKIYNVNITDRLHINFKFS